MFSIELMQAGGIAQQPLSLVIEAMTIRNLSRSTQRSSV
jgi:hypothetical protein